MVLRRCLAVSAALCVLLHHACADQVLTNLVDRVRSEVTGGALPAPRIRDFGAVLDSQYRARDAAFEAQHAASTTVSRPLATTVNNTGSSASQQNVSAAAAKPDGAQTPRTQGGPGLQHANTAVFPGHILQNACIQGALA